MLVDGHPRAFAKGECWRGNRRIEGLVDGQLHWRRRLGRLSLFGLDRHRGQKQPRNPPMASLHARILTPRGELTHVLASLLFAAVLGIRVLWQGKLDSQ